MGGRALSSMLLVGLGLCLGAGCGDDAAQSVVAACATEPAEYRGVRSTSATTEFTTLSSIYTVSDGGFPAEVLMYLEGSEAGVDLFVDDVVVAPLSR